MSQGIHKQKQPRRENKNNINEEQSAPPPITWPCFAVWRSTCSNSPSRRLSPTRATLRECPSFENAFAIFAKHAEKATSATMEDGLNARWKANKKAKKGNLLVLRKTKGTTINKRKAKEALWEDAAKKSPWVPKCKQRPQEG